MKRTADNTVNEPQNPPKQYSIINRAALMEIFSIKEDEYLRNKHRVWIEPELKNGFQQHTLIGAKPTPEALRAI